MISAERDILFDAASRIGGRLTAAAAWSGDSCTWDVVTGDESRVAIGPQRVISANGSLYQGTAGIALFLAELARLTGDQCFMKYARGAMRHAIRDEAQRRVPCSLYSGAMGVAYAASRIATITGDDEWVSVVREAPEQAVKVISRDRAFDVIAGAAGAVLGLLGLSRDVVGDSGVIAAVTVGEHLESHATIHPYGWSWGPVEASYRQDLCGYSHGASGIAHAFLELFAETGDARWKHAATRAMQYERHQYHLSGREDWPDYRDLQLMQRFRTPADVIQLRADLRVGARVPRSTVAYAHAWCHGAPGIALTRLRAMTLGVDAAASTTDARLALERTNGTLLSLAQRGQSLCHGVLGNAESLLHAERQAGWAYGSVALRVALDGIGRFEFAGKPWPSGNMGSAPDPTLMMGDAGIGLYLLELADSSVPSALFFSDWGPATLAETGDATTARQREAAQSFGRYEVITTRLRSAKEATLDTAIASGADTPQEVLFAVEAAQELLPVSKAQEQLSDALAPEAALLRAQVAFTDYAQQRLDEIRVLGVTEIDWTTVHVQVAPSVEIVDTAWSWRAWMNDNASAEPERGRENYAVHRRGKSVLLTPLSTLDAFVFELMRTPTTIAELQCHVAAAADIAPHARAEIEAGVQRCVEEGVNTGIIWATP